jgi:hypothetical protein
LWDQDRILLIDYLSKGRTINAGFYSSLLVQLKDILKEKRRGKATKGSCSYTTTLRLTGHLQPRKKLVCLGILCLDHLPYSPDLAPWDYHMFPGLNKQLKVCHFWSYTEVIAVSETWFDGQHSKCV